MSEESIATKLLSQISSALDDTLTIACNSNVAKSPVRTSSNATQSGTITSAEEMGDLVRELVPLHFASIVMAPDNLNCAEREWKDMLSQALEVETRVKLQDLVVSLLFSCYRT